MIFEGTWVGRKNLDREYFPSLQILPMPARERGMQAAETSNPKDLE